MKRLLITLAVLSALFVAADRVAARVAQNQVSAQIKTSQRLSAEPQVTIRGFPFLTQAFGGEYDDIEVVGTDLVSGSIKVGRVEADLRGVKISLSDALGGSLGAVPVTQATVRADVGWDALENASGEAVKLEAARGGGVQVSTVVSGRTIRFVADPVVERGQVVLVPRDVAGRTISFGTTTLPFGMRLTSAQVRPSGLVLVATGAGITLKG